MKKLLNKLPEIIGGLAVAWLLVSFFAVNLRIDLPLNFFELVFG